MEHHGMTDDLQRRLRAARPESGRVQDGAFDGALLARVREQPIAARRTIPRAVAVPVTAGVTLTVAGVLMFASGPGEVGGPSSAAAVTQAALRWLDPPPGTVLHVRSVEASGARTTTRELWQSAGAPAAERQVITGTNAFERSAGALYDPATDTIYEATGKAPAGAEGDDDKQPGMVQPAVGGKPGAGDLPAGDDVVRKVRLLLQDGRMSVTGRETHAGVEAWAISLKPDAGRPVWTLWVAADDGRPLELRDPGRDASEQPQVIRWPTYEVLRGDGARRLTTLTGAHPSATIVRDAQQVAAAQQRFMPDEP